MKRSIVIVGLGLIGGSLAARCRRKFPRARIIGITRNPKSLATAKKRGWIHEGYRHCEAAFLRHPEGSFARHSEPPQGAKNLWDQGRLRPEGSRDPSATSWPQDDGPCLVILCTPVDTLKGYLRRLDRIAPPGTVVTDAGSVKGFLVRWADEQDWKRIQFVGAHPMAGSHERGMEAARVTLFDDSFAFVTPGRQKSPLRTVKNFWRRICGRVVVMSAEAHDRFTAEISHLPHFLAAVLVSSVSRKSLGFAASGFLDTTRVARGDPRLWAPIFRGNRKELMRAILRFERALGQAKKILGKDNSPALRQLIFHAKRRREGLA